MTRVTPLVSVVVPVRDNADVLALTLEALEASDLPRSRWELLVVDDSSGDDSAVVAARYADALVRLTGPARGPAYARNRGAEIARADVVLFLAPDVQVRPDSLRRVALALAADREVTAISAVCTPRQHASLATRYRFDHGRFAGERSAADAPTFSPACGAIRRAAFIQAGMWDEWRLHQPRTEAAELGSRLRALGHRLVIDRSVEVEQLREWNAASMLAEDLRDPGMHLFPTPQASGLARGWRAGLRQRIDVAAVILLALALVIMLRALLVDDVRMLVVAGVAVVLTLAADAAFYAVLYRRGGFVFALSVVPLHLASSLTGGVAALFAWMRQHAIGEPRPHPSVEAFAELGTDAWPPAPRRRMPEFELPR